MTTTITIDRAVVEQALEALQYAYENLPLIHAGEIDEKLEALRAALEQPVEQEPVAWSVFDKRTKKHWYTHDSKYTAQHYSNEYSHREPDGTPHNVVVPLYASPQPAKQPREPSVDGVLIAVEEAIRNGDCPWQIEQAFDEYEAERRNSIKEGS